MSAIDDFLAGSSFAVAGASQDRSKYGNRVLRAYLERGYDVTPVNPKETEVEGLSCVATLAELPADLHGLSIVTPPPVTEELVEQAARHGIRRLWMQPGAESARAIDRGRELGLDVIAGGPCVLVELARRDAARDARRGTTA